LKLLLDKNVINLLKQKEAQKLAIILGFFILSKNHNKPPILSLNLVTMVSDAAAE
jgi:hypothetical protein